MTLLAAMLLELAARSPSRIASPETLALLGKVNALVAIVGMFIVVLPIVLFNQPKFLVPRGLRDEPGLLKVGIESLRRLFSPKKR